jgi:hypothetical protein
MAQRYELFSVVVIVLLAVSECLGIYLGAWKLSDVLSSVPFFILNALGKKTTTTDSSEVEDSELDRVAKSSSIATFAHLTIHYSQKTDDPNTLIKSAQPRCVTNNITHGVYFVPDWLKPYIRFRKISVQPHDGERALRRFVSEYARAFSENSEPLARELGLKFEGNRLVLLQESDLVSKLKGHKFEDLRVVFLRRIRARRTLLLNRSTKEAWEAPLYVGELLENGIIADFQNLGMRPWENCKSWCKHQGYTFHPWRYPESELTKGL